MDRAIELVERRGAKAQLCVLHGDAIVVDRAFGCDPRALFWIFSATKPYPAVLVHLLAERGELDLDAPVARYWPEFARHGKNTVTVRHVLRHRTGLAAPGGAPAEIAAMAHWDLSVRLAQEARLRQPPGSPPAYGFLNYGFVLGEVITRVSGRTVQAFLADEMLHPLGLADSYLGLPPAEWPRHVPISGVTGTALNRPFVRAAVIPAAGLSTTARDLATFYRMLLRGGVHDGRRLLGSDTVARMVRPTSDGEIDRRIKLPIRWSEGFQLGGAERGPMGRLVSRRTFGHNGSNCCIAWADPDRDLVVAYLTNRVESPRRAVPHLAAVADALVGAYDA